MKKIILVCFLVVMAKFMSATLAPSSAFADEVVDSKGVIIPCKIETVCDGLIEYKKDGCLYNFTREKDCLVFNDYVDVRVNMLKKNNITRYNGKIIAKDLWAVKIRNDNGDIEIPWYKIKFIGIYKP